MDSSMCLGCHDVDVLDITRDMLDFMTRSKAKCNDSVESNAECKDPTEVASDVAIEGVRLNCGENRALEAQHDEVMGLKSRIESIERFSVTKHGKKRVRTVAELNENVEALEEIREKVRRLISASVTEITNLERERERITNNADQSSTTANTEEIPHGSECVDVSSRQPNDRESDFDEDDFVPF